jgi:hypothetical protein
MPDAAMRPRSKLAFALSLFALGCHDKPSTSPVPSATASAALAASAAARPAPSAHAEERDEPLDASAVVTDGGAFALGELSDVGPAGPASASPKGVVLITRDDDVLLAALPAKGAFKPVELDAGAFARYARGASVAGEFAYWISKHRLVRKKVAGGPLEILAEPATDGTRVAAVAARDGHPAAAAFIAPSKSGQDLVAMVWIEGGDIQRMSPGGSAASSVALGPMGGDLLAVYLEGRTGMTPVHARQLAFSDGKAKLDEDVVVWVAGPAQPSTEVVTGPGPSRRSWAFVPLERDTTRFGLAELDLGEKPSMDIDVTWRGYPNGLSPAPITASEACGQTLVAFVRPSEAKPGAPQELCLAPLDAAGLGASQVVARTKAFSNVSIAPVSNGVLVVYVGDGRTWAARATCAK